MYGHTILKHDTITQKLTRVLKCISKMLTDILWRLLKQYNVKHVENKQVSDMGRDKVN